MYQFFGRRRSAAVKFFLLAVLVIVLCNEWFVYSMQPIFWRNIGCPERQDKFCTKILFIADPQIQGDMEVGPPLSYLFNWDSDRYLRLTFGVALKYFEPNILVYLGDLMDEGSISTMVQFHKYVKRLSNIFDVANPYIQVWLPGDNDIGGENEPIYKDKVDEFQKVFDQPSIITYKNVSIIKVNAITHSIIQPSEKEIDKNDYKIVVSHYPILQRSIFSQKVQKKIQPNIYFCAHEHKSKYVVKNQFWKNKDARIITPRDDVLNIPFDYEGVYEIYVPTCSYRMGTSSIGYGAAVISANNTLLQYTVLWSPQRFPALFAYAFIALCFVLYVFAFIVPKMILRCARDSKNGKATQPLLYKS